MNVPLEIIIVLLVAFSTLLGWMLNRIVGNGNSIGILTETAKDIRELLNRVIKRQDEQDNKIDTLTDSVNSITTEHNMVKAAGNILQSHGYEKKTP